MKSEIKADRIVHKNQLKQYTSLAALGAFLLITLILCRNTLREKKAKNVLRQQKEEIQSTLSQQNQLGKEQGGLSLAFDIVTKGYGGGGL